MSRKNYSKFSQHFNKNQEQINNVEVNNEVLDEQISIDEVIDETNIEDNNETSKISVVGVIGIVTGCEKLNVRKQPNKNSDPITTISKNTEVAITLTGSTEEFYKITTSTGLEGYCMKKFITIK